MASKKTTKQLLANPAWRAQISDADLKKASPDLYAKRVAAKRVKQENATLYDPTVVLSGQNLRRSVNSMVDAETRPAMAALDRSISQRQNQGTQMAALTDSSYDRMADRLAGTISNANTSATKASADAATRAANLQTQIQGFAQQSQGMAAADAAKRGPGLDAGIGTQIAQTQQQAQSNAAQQTSASGTNATNQATQFASLANAMAGASTLARGEAQRSISDKTTSDVSDLQGKRADIVTSRGTLRSKYTQDMRQQQFTNAATLSGLSTTAAKLRQDAADDQADNSRADAALSVQQQNANTSAGRLTESQRHNRVLESISASRAASSSAGKPNGKDAYGNTPKQQMAAQDSYTKALTVAKQYDSKKESEESLYSLLVSPQGGNLNPSMARAAAQMLKIGRVGPNTARRLRKAGVRKGYQTAAQVGSTGSNAARAHGYSG